jgi:hypothetical protein
VDGLPHLVGFEVVVFDALAVGGDAFGGDQFFSVG